DREPENRRGIPGNRSGELRVRVAEVVQRSGRRAARFKLRRTHHPAEPLELTGAARRLVGPWSRELRLLPPLPDPEQRVNLPGGRSEVAGPLHPHVSQQVGSLKILAVFRPTRPAPAPNIVG